MRHLRSFVGVLAAALLAVGATFSLPADARAKEVVLRMVQPAPPGDYPLTYKDVELAKRFNERVKGRYRMEVHPGGALAKIPEYFDAVRIGAVEMADVSWGIFAFLDPRFAAAEAPFLLDSLEGSIYAAKKFLPLYDAVFQEKFNAKALGMFSLDGIALVGTKPVKTLDDWKGLLAGAGTPVTASFFKGLGAAPVTIMWTDLYESLQKKIIDASAQTAHGALSMNLTDVCDHVIYFHGQTCFNGYTINLDVWKKMPKDIQKILQEEIDHSVKWMEKTQVGLRDDDIKTFRKKGTKIIMVPRAERDKWVRVVAPVRDQQLTSLGDFGAKIKAIADEANRKYPYDDKFLK